MPYQTTGTSGHFLLASFCAGPIFLIVTAAEIVLVDKSVSLTSTLGLMLLLPVASVVGFFLAAIPNALGTVLLGWSGRGNVASRLPVMWALIGGLAAGSIAYFGQAATDVVATFAATGTISVLICRSGARWA